MSFRLRQGLNALVTLGVLAACNTYTPDLLTEEEPDTTSDGSDMDSTSATGSGGSSGDLTTTINTVTSTSAGTNGGDGGSGGGTTASADETTTGGGSAGDSSSGSTNTETETTNTSTNTTGGGSGGSDNTTGSGGNGGTGGNGGDGGTSSTTSNPVNELLIDDLEDGNNQLETPTYSGYWFTTANEEGDGTLVPPPDDDCDPVDLETPRDLSERAMHISGTWSGTDLEWIAAAGFTLRHDEAPVDASNYTGVTFYARTDDEDTEAHLQVMLTDVKDEGHFAIELSLTDAWEEYTILWSDPLLMQPTWAAAVDFDPATLFKFQFQFDSETFDLWVDDIQFIEEPP